MRLLSIRSARRGMTLVEVAIAMLISGLVALCMLALLIGGIDGWGRGTSKMYAETSASLAAQKIAQEIRDAQSASTASGTLTVTLPLESSDANGEYCYSRGTAGQVRQYFVRNGKLMRSVAGNESVVLNRVSQVSFAVSGADISITATGTEQAGVWRPGTLRDRQATVRVRLRNYSI